MEPLVPFLWRDVKNYLNLQFGWNLTDDDVNDKRRLAECKQAVHEECESPRLETLENMTRCETYIRLAERDKLDTYPAILHSWLDRISLPPCTSIAQILKWSRYFETNRWGQPVEVREMVYYRLLTCYGPKHIAPFRLFRNLANNAVWFSHPTIRYAGLPYRVQPAACFLACISTLEEGMDRVMNLAAHKGGIGLNVSEVEDKETFLYMLDIYLSNRRKSKKPLAVAVYVDIHHEDWSWVVQEKRQSKNKHLFNIQVGLMVSDAFMETLRDKGVWAMTRDRLTHLKGDEYRTAYAQSVKTKTMTAEECIQIIRDTQLESGNPYLVFRDTVNDAAPAYWDTITNLNLCTEIAIPSLRNGLHETATCNIGVINLASLWRDGAVDLDYFAELVEEVFYYIDNMIESMQHDPKVFTQKLNEEKPMAIGVCGFHSLILLMGMNYEDEDVKLLSHILASHLRFYAQRYSGRDAPLNTYFDTNSYVYRAHSLPLRGKYFAGIEEMWHRSAHKTLVGLMPTANSSTVLGVSPCIEPWQSHQYREESRTGSFLVNTGLPSNHRTAFEIPTRHLTDVACAWQPYVDNAIALNRFLDTTTPYDLAAEMLYAWENKLKTFSYYTNIKIHPQAAVERDPAEKFIRVASNLLY